MHMSIHVRAHMSIHMPGPFLYPCLLGTHMSLRMSAHTSIHMPIHMPIHGSTHMATFRSLGRCGGRRTPAQDWGRPPRGRYFFTFSFSFRSIFFLAGHVLRGDVAAVEVVVVLRDRLAEQRVAPRLRVEPVLPCHLHAAEKKKRNGSCPGGDRGVPGGAPAVLSRRVPR